MMVVVRSGDVRSSRPQERAELTPVRDRLRSGGFCGARRLGVLRWRSPPRSVGGVDQSDLRQRSSRGRLTQRFHCQRLRTRRIQNANTSGLSAFNSPPRRRAGTQNERAPPQGAARVFCGAAPNRRTATALEKVSRNPALVRELAARWDIPACQAAKMIRSRLRNVEGLDDFMRLTGVVKEHVTCTPPVEDDIMQLQDLGNDCWRLVRRYLSFDDVKCHTVTKLD
ncbi:hypothetical protein MRX96_047904 [Rhipicephalus microplus]